MNDFMEVFEVIFQNISQVNMILVVILFLIGLFLKYGIKKLNNVFIIVILFFIAIFLIWLRDGSNIESTYSLLEQSFLVTGGAVGLNEGPKQFFKYIRGKKHP